MPRPHEYSYVTRDPYTNPKGLNDGWWVTHVSYGKESIYSTDSPSPYLFPNEWICGNIAQFLRIPVPPFAVMRGDPKDPIMFTNLQFTPGRTPPPDAGPSLCWKADKHLCTGIVLFDMLIANEDRRPANIAVDNPASPTEFFVHDHDKALLGGMYGDGRVHLRKAMNSFGFDWHCLIGEVDTDEYIPDWVGRIQSIPPWFIDDVCAEARTRGFSMVDAKAAAKFLKWRSRNFASNLLNPNRHRFTSIKRWSVIV